MFMSFVSKAQKPEACRARSSHPLRSLAGALEPRCCCGKGQTSGTPPPDAVGRSLCKGSLSKGVRLTMNPGKNSNKRPIVPEILHVLRNRGLAVYSETDHVLKKTTTGRTAQPDNRGPSAGGRACDLRPGETSDLSRQGSGVWARPQDTSSGGW